MGHIHASIELINAHDKELRKKGTMDKDDIRRIRVSALVDTGSIYMAINENIQQILQLPVVGKERFGLRIVQPIAVRSYCQMIQNLCSERSLWKKWIY
jgi:hypothetical protein